MGAQEIERGEEGRLGRARSRGEGRGVKMGKRKEGVWKWGGIRRSKSRQNGRGEGRTQRGRWRKEALGGSGTVLATHRAQALWLRSWRSVERDN